MSPKNLIFAAALLGGTAVVLGAFGAHALKERLEPSALVSFETGVRYQLVHALALLAVAGLLVHAPQGLFRAAGLCFLLGILLFSGSIYLLATRSLYGADQALAWLGPVTPLGGLLLILGWCMVAAGALKLP